MLPVRAFASFGTCCVDTAEQIFSLTYDDGPDPIATPRILDTLTSHGATATFFVLGRSAARQPSLLRRIAEEGHEVALHGMDHRSLLTMPAREASVLIQASRTLIEDIIGKPVDLYRPPYGAYRLSHARLIRDLGLDLVIWSGDAVDWADDTVDNVVNRVLDRLFPGTIMLLHDACGDADLRGTEDPLPTFDRSEVLDRILHSIKEQGYETLTVGELLKKYRRVISLAPHRMMHLS